MLTDGELYSGTAADFMGRDFAIFRTLGHHHPIRTEQHDSRWLNGKSGMCFIVFLVDTLRNLAHNAGSLSVPPLMFTPFLYGIAPDQ